MSDRSRGVVYVATGAAHLEAARRSAASLRASNPGLPVALFTDAPAPGPEFDHVEPVEAPHIRSKVDALWRSPFAESLYLDGDTRVMGSLDDGFALLARFDIAAAHVPRWYLPTYQRQWRHAVPPSFPQHDGGVIFYRRTPAVTAFLEAWRDAYHAAGFEADQVTFRDLLWASDLRIAVLPEVFNTRRMPPLGGALSAKPTPIILHMRRFHPSKRKWWQRNPAPRRSG
jgi:hypothetical protein